jgi:hypothetical protein
MLTDASPGFPLVDAAGSGNLSAVDMLIQAGSMFMWHQTWALHYKRQYIRSS